MTAPPTRRALDAAEPVPAMPALPAVALAEMWSALWRRRGTVLGVAGLALAVAVAALAKLEPRYAAVAEVLLEDRAPRVVELAEVSPAMLLDAQTVQSELRLVQSQQLLGRVVRNLRLAEDPEFGAAEAARAPGPFDAALAWLGDLAGLSQAPAAGRDPARAELEAIEALRERLAVSRRELSRVIAIRVESADPAKAALIANAIADQYVVDQLEAKFDATRRAADWLERRLDELAPKLEEAEARAAEASDRRAVDLAGGAEATRPRMVELSVALEGLPPGSPRRAALAETLEALRAKAEAQAAADIAVARLEREAEATRALHDAFLARLKETRAQSGLQQPDARLIAAAAPPLRPSFPNAPLILGFALTGGLALGAALAFVQESVAGVWHAPEAAEAETGLKILAAIPRVPGRRPDPGRRGPPPPRRRAGRGGARPARGRGSGAGRRGARRRRRLLRAGRGQVHAGRPAGRKLRPRRTLRRAGGLRHPPPGAGVALRAGGRRGRDRRAVGRNAARRRAAARP